jgi:NAD(P)-dependent dehydrogenase (short-subunit alcohol dehydrogenase family)
MTSDTTAGVLIVTGASRGIGAAIARIGARAGYAVCVNYANSRAPAEALVAEIGAVGGRLRPGAAQARKVAGDVADPRV